MVQMAFAYGGAAIGSYFGGPVGAQIGYAAGSLIGGLLFRPAGPHLENQGPRLSDLKVQASTYGAPIAWVRGEFRLAGNVIWCRPIHEVVTVTEQQTGGGKGGPSGGTTQTTTYTYFGRFAVGVCEGPRDVMKIFANGKLIFERAPKTVKLTEADTYYKYGKATITTYRGVDNDPYFGVSSQVADPFIESFEGAGNVPGYRGLCYIVFNDLPLADFGNSIPQIEVVTTVGYPTMTAAIYTDNAGTPGKLVAESEPLTVGYSPVFTRLVDPPNLGFFGGFDWGVYHLAMDDPIAAGEYWIGVVGDGAVQISHTSTLGLRSGIDFYPGFEQFADSIMFQFVSEVGANVTCGAINNNWLEPDLAFLPAADFTYVPLQMKVQVRTDIPTETGFSTLEDQNLAQPSYIALSNGNLTCEGLARQGTDWGSLNSDPEWMDQYHKVYARAIASEQKNIAETQGKMFYWEVHVDAVGTSTRPFVGAGPVGAQVTWVYDEASEFTNMNGAGANDYGIGGFFTGLGPLTSPNLAGDCLMFALAFDPPALVPPFRPLTESWLWVGRNGTWINGTPMLPTNPDFAFRGPTFDFTDGSPIAGSGGPIGQANAYPACQPFEGDKFTFNFGASPFTYGPPDGAELWTQDFKYYGTMNATPPKTLGYDYEGLFNGGTPLAIGSFVGIPDAGHYFGTRELTTTRYKGLTKLALPDCTITEMQLPIFELDFPHIAGAGNTMNLYDHVSELLSKTILRPEDYDLAALLPYSVRGIGIGRPQTVRQAIQMLADICFFDLIESDGKLKAVIRGGRPIATVPEGDLAAVTGQLGPPVPKIDDKRVQDRDLPETVIINYQCSTLDFQANAAKAQRLQATNSAKTIVTQDYSVCLGTRKAHNLAAKLLWTMWAYRRQIQMVLPSRYVKYDAGDVLTVTIDGQQKAVYLNAVEYGADNLVTMKGVINDSILVRDSLATGGERAGTLNFVTQTGTQVEQTDLLLFDAPLLRAVDDTYGCYVGAHGIAIPNGVWKGDTVYKLE